MSAQPNGYAPIWPFTDPHLQSVLASSGLRGWSARRRYPDLAALAQPVLLDCGDNVRLLGFHSAQRRLPQAKGLVVLIHGWEGCADSSYLLATGGRLLDAGFDVFRLQLRDHGDTHHLNEELFHSCRLPEVLGAMADIARRFPTRPLLVGGFSLGGNFALRVGLHGPQQGLPLAGVVAVCPPINPKHSMEAIERAPFVYEWYFIRKWTRSLRRKQALFPQHYRFESWLRKPTLRSLTDQLVCEYTEYGHMDRYLDGYSVEGDRLAPMQVPTTILAASDDPVIPIGDFHELVVSDSTELQLTDHGGHCGYLTGPRLRSWAEERFLGAMERYAGGAQFQ